jgi:osmotically-inducible protein OsmY
VTRVLKVVAATTAATVAVAAAFFLHPRSGAQRRAAVRRESANVAAMVGSAIEGGPSRLRRDGPDRTIEDRARLVLSETFGDESGQIKIRAHDGIVTLRGEVEQLRDITRYDDAVRTVRGVVDVDNLLRLRLTDSIRPRILTA